VRFHVSKLALKRCYAEDIEELLAGCTIDGIDSLIFLSDTPKDDDYGKFTKDLYPVIFQHIDFNTLSDWVRELGGEEIESNVLKILRSCTQHIIMDRLIDLEWLDVERMVAELFRGLGFKVELTPTSKDGGKDIILELEERGETKSYIIEIKHWRSKQKVGMSAVNKFVKIVVQEKRAGGLFLSTYGVSEKAVATLTKIERKKVKFGGKEKIMSLCESYIKKKDSGLWCKNLELDKLLLHKTF